MANAFHHHHLLQQWAIFLQPAFVNVVFRARGIVGQVEIPDHEFHRYLDLSSRPRCRHLPISATPRMKKGPRLTRATLIDQTSF